MRPLRPLLLALTLALCSCQEKLETGYSPRRLDASDADRRSFYAPEFTPDAKPKKENAPPPDLTPNNY